MNNFFYDYLQMNEPQHEMYNPTLIYIVTY
jgi:hypothetical protein